MNQHAKRRQQAFLRLYPEAPPEAAVAPPRAPVPDAVDVEFPIVFVVAPEHAGLRLDLYLSQRPELSGNSLSRTRLQALATSGYVSIDMKLPATAGEKLKAGQTIILDVPEPEPAEPEGEDIALNVVFEDGHLLVIDKPAGLVVHPGAGHATGTLVNALIHHCGASLSGIGGVKRPGIVHRLDKNTSGLLVVAKSDAAHHGLSLLFADHGRTLSLTRRYIALVWGSPERSAGMVDAPIGRHATHREKMAVVPASRGREAITHFRVEQGFGRDKLGKARATRISCELETGRTHQIRVHMAHTGNPVVGDPVYAAGFRTRENSLTEASQLALTALGRQALHAAVLGFEHPVTGKEMLFESPLPPDIARLIAALEQE